jgi:hypothetical protein
MMKLEVDKKILNVVLAPPVRMDFRGLTQDMLKPGTMVTIVGYLHKQTKDEVRAETIKVGTRTTDLR